MNRRLEKHYRRSGVEDFARSPRFRLRAILGSLAAFVVLCLLHFPLLRLPYYWDEAGYYIPAAMDFYRSGQLVPSSTLTTGHTPLVIIYLALAWRAFGFSPLVTRAAMIVFAACTLTGVYALGRRVANREIGCWSVLLLALSPLFFAQSVLAHLDLAAGLFTLLALLALLDERPWSFALAATCAVLSKETALVLLPVAWIFSWWQHRRAASSLPRAWWVAFLAPLVVLVAWAGFYHQATGFWTGNREYLRYNLYSTLNPVRMLLALLRRLYETFCGRIQLAPDCRRHSRNSVGAEERNWLTSKQISSLSRVIPILRNARRGISLCRKSLTAGQPCRHGPPPRRLLKSPSRINRNRIFCAGLFFLGAGSPPLIW